MKLVYSKKEVLPEEEPKKISFTTVNRVKCARLPTLYYKKVCLDCEAILGIQWKRKYQENQTTFRLATAQRIEECIFCNSSNVKTLTINKTEYLAISQHWDLGDLASSDEENLERSL